MWYQPGGIANIYSMKLMSKKHRVTFDSHGEGDSANAFVVHRPNGPLRFTTSDLGLYFRDTACPRATALATPATRGVVWQSGDATEGMTRSDVMRAGTARRLQQTMGFPSDADFDGMVRGHMLRDCSVQTRDISNAKAIFGPSVDAVRGKTTRRNPQPARSHYVEVPRIIRERNRLIDISADIFFVNGLPFFVTQSRRLRFITAEALADSKEPALIAALTQVVNLYKCFGFRVHTCFADGEFAKLENKIEGLNMDTTGNNEHVGDIERLIRVLKERIRAIRSSIPCKRLPRRVIIELITFVVFWLNSHPPKGGVSRTYSPRTILLDTTVSQRLHCRLPFGSYAETHDNPSIPNDTRTMRTTPALCLGPTGNERGTYRFFSLNTGRILRRYAWTEMPYTPSTVDRVQHMATADNQPDGLIFGDRQNRLLERVAPDMFDQLASRHPLSLLDRPGILVAGQRRAALLTPTETEPLDPITEEEEPEFDPDFGGGQAPFAPEHDCAAAPAAPPVTPATTATDVAPPAPPPAPVAAASRYPSRERAPPLHIRDDLARGNELPATRGFATNVTSHSFAAVGSSMFSTKIRPTALTLPTRHKALQALMRTITNTDTVLDHARTGHTALVTTSDADLLTENQWAQVTHMVMTQYGYKAAIRKFGPVADKAITAELTKVHQRDAFAPQNAKTLTYEQKRRALESIMHVKHKRDDSKRARLCADGRKQRLTMRKDETASPTVCTDSTFITAAMEAAEHRRTAVVDLPSAYLHADMDDEEEVLMVLRGDLANMMALAAPDVYRKYITITTDGKPILYVKLCKALYGCLKSALLFLPKTVG